MIVSVVIFVAVLGGGTVYVLHQNALARRDAAALRRARSPSTPEPSNVRILTPTTFVFDWARDVPDLRLRPEVSDRGDEGQHPKHSGEPHDHDHR